MIILIAIKTNANNTMKSGIICLADRTNNRNVPHVCNATKPGRRSSSEVLNSVAALTRLGIRHRCFFCSCWWIWWCRFLMAFSGQQHDGNSVMLCPLLLKINLFFFFFFTQTEIPSSEFWSSIKTRMEFCHCVIKRNFGSSKTTSVCDFLQPLGDELAVMNGAILLFWAVEQLVNHVRHILVRAILRSL